jgi:hypothetical protein
MFYILTCGSTASVWLSRVLSHHPEIVCFHGLKAIPTDPYGGSGPHSAEEFVKALCQLHDNAQNEIVFGAIHGFSAAEIVPEIVAINGTLMAMIRHPVTRLNSLFQRVIEGYCADQRMADGALQTAQDGVGLTGEEWPQFSGDSKIFYNLCNNVIDGDIFIIDTMDRDDVFQFERIVAEREYFRQCFETLAESCRRSIKFHKRRPGSQGSVALDCGDQYLDSVFSRDRINRKNRGSEFVEEIFARWPDRFKATFIAQLRGGSGGRDAVERYAEWGYQLPKDVGFAVSRRSAESPSTSEAGTRCAAAPPAYRSYWPSGSDLKTSPVVAGRPEDDGRVPPAHVRQLLSIIESERATYADTLLASRNELTAERVAFKARISELEKVAGAEHAASAARIAELDSVLNAERAAFGSRIDELETVLGAERAAFGDRIDELETVLGAERAAFGSRIDELETVLGAERAAFGDRIDELETVLRGERAASIARITELEQVRGAERTAYIARIMELQGG